MPTFVPGLQLNEAFYREVVKPLLHAEFPGLAYSAALIGYGSDVLGLDTERSTDHGWGPRLWLFLARGDGDTEARLKSIREMFRQKLPLVFRGYPTNYGRSPNDSVPVLRAIDAPPVNHEIIIVSLPQYVVHRLGFDPLGEITVRDWLLTPTQQLLELTAGAVFHDGLHYLAPMRTRLAWYPDAVWRAIMAAQWQRVWQEEAFIGRCGEVGDELGSAVVAARLVRDLMRLCFLIERQYAPYSKWLGTAFTRGLICGPTLTPIFTAVLTAVDWHTRERHLSAAYEQIAAMHNALGITPPLTPNVAPFYGRPFLISRAHRFVEALQATLPDDPILRNASIIGAIDQFSDSTDLHNRRSKNLSLGVLYE